MSYRVTRPTGWPSRAAARVTVAGRPPGRAGHNGRLPGQHVTGAGDLGGRLAVGQAERDDQPPLSRRDLPCRDLPRTDNARWVLPCRDPARTWGSTRAQKEGGTAQAASSRQPSAPARSQ